MLAKSIEFWPPMMLARPVLVVPAVHSSKPGRVVAPVLLAEHVAPVPAIDSEENDPHVVLDVPHACIMKSSDHSRCFPR